MINLFIRRSEKAVTDMRNYYNDITLNNLAMISTLKEEIKSKEERLERNEQVRERKNNSLDIDCAYYDICYVHT